MEDAAFIPFQTQLTPLFRSTRVHNAIYQPVQRRLRLHPDLALVIGIDE